MKDKKNTAPKGKKKKMQLAKDPQQAVMAVIVMLVFFLYTIYNIVTYVQSQQVATQPNPDAAANMAAGQQKSLEGIEPGNLGNPADSQNLPQDANNIYSETLKLKGETPGDQSDHSGSAKSPVEDDVEIMSSADSKYKNSKKIMITVAGSGRSNPFLPAGENFSPSSLPKFTLLPPPEQLAVNSEASSVMGTTISGILYDKYSPSAIITIGGTDYLVKKGDVINRYRILSISKDQVIVQLGKNVYKAGVGELLTEGQMNYNTISNLNKKFGGSEVSINVRKKGY